MLKTVLFLCTGNYYRSRFAEIFFNHLAHKAGLDWTADSAALALERGYNNVGPISQHAVEQLSLRDIVGIDRSRYPRQVKAREIRDADIVIAMQESEHRPLVERRFRKYAGKVEYWDIADVGQLGAGIGCQEIEQQVRLLVSRLTHPDPDAMAPPRGRVPLEY